MQFTKETLYLFLIIFIFLVFTYIYVIGKLYKDKIRLKLSLQRIFLFLIFLGLLIYFFIVYYFASIQQNNTSFILWFLLSYIILITIFIYYCYIFLAAKYADKKLPWTFYKDSFLPLLLIFMPLVCVLSLNIIHIWLHKIIFLIVLHIFFVIPFLTFWNKYRDLPDISKESNSWKHSQVYIHIALAMVYPLIFILYISLIRYLRLGETFDIRNITLMFIDLDIIIFVIFLSPLILYWILVLYIILRDLRTVLWAYTASISYSIHIKMLEYQDYFYLTEKIFKLTFLSHDIISLSSGATTYDYKQASRLRKAFSYIYYHPFVLTIIFISSLCIELILSQGTLYYGVYTLFYYPLILGIIHCFNLFGCTRFIQDVCMSDYISFRFNNPRYLEKFWIYYGNAAYYYGFVHQFSEEVELKLNRIALISNTIAESKLKHNQQLFYRVWGRKYIYYGPKNPQSNRTSEIVILGQPRLWSIRVAGVFKSKHRVRWFHTSSRLLTKPLHSWTIHFIHKNPYAVLALLNHPNQNFALIQKLSKNISWPSATTLYKNIPENIKLGDQTTLLGVLENNFAMNFVTLEKNGVILGVYTAMRNYYGYAGLEAMQMRPDMLSVWLTSNFKYKGYLGIDQKNKVFNHFGRNQALTNPSISYDDILSKFTVDLEKKFVVTARCTKYSKSCKKVHIILRSILYFGQRIFIYFLHDMHHRY